LVDSGRGNGSQLVSARDSYYPVYMWR
jgi:hypothetical protein